MAESILERIALDLLADLQTITTGNGYNYTLSVSRRLRSHENPVDLSAFLELGSAVPVDKESHGKTGWYQIFKVAVVSQQTEADATDADKRISRIFTDIAKCVETDYGRGGLAQDTNVVGWELWDLGVAVNIEIHYRHVWNDPTTL
jgi:hypothetical protein